MGVGGRSALQIPLCLLFGVIDCATFVLSRCFVGWVMVIKERISVAVVKNARVELKRINDNQYQGFHARLGKLRADGSRLISYYFFYRVGGRNGRQSNYFIGNSDTMDAGVARRIAGQIHPLVKAGKDILKLKFQSEKEQVRLKDFWRFSGREYFEKKYKNSDDYIRNIERDVLPNIGSVHLRKLSDRLIQLRVFKPLIERGKPNQVKAVASQLKSLLGYAIETDYLTSLPIKSPLIGHANAESTQGDEVVISPAQIKAIYYRATKESGNKPYLYTLRLQILTGQSLSTILASYRQDIKGNYWSLRSTSGKLTGKVIPLQGPLKALLKEVLERFSTAQSLYLLPSKKCNDTLDVSLDPRALAKSQQRFIINVIEQKISMSKLCKQVEAAMVTNGVPVLVVAYLFDRKVEDYLRLFAKDPVIAAGLTQWYNG